MKRSYEFPEKINRDKKPFSSADPPQSDISHKLLGTEDLQSEKSPLLEDSFRSRITSKLKTVLDASRLPCRSSHSDADFLRSAKLHISGLLSRQQKQEVISKEKFRVDPLQIRISLKLQDLLCKALDGRCKNEETEWQDLSHLLQDFLSSAKKKISFSLTSDKTPAPGGEAACNKGTDTHRKNCRIGNKVRKWTRGSSFRAMESDSSCDGILLLSDAEKAPDYLDLSLEVDEDSEVDDPGFKVNGFKGNEDSDDEVVVLGEKRPTYQEITLDEEGEVCEQEVVVEPKKVRIPKDLEDLLYDCPNCEKKYRLESLLKFHVRMHNVVESKPRATPAPATAPEEPKSPTRTPKSRKQKENKLNSKSSRQHKIQKHARRKVKITS